MVDFFTFKDKMKAICGYGAYFCLLLCLQLMTSHGLDFKTNLHQFLQLVGIVIAIWLIQRLFGIKIFNKYWSTCIIVGWCWSLAVPILESVGNNDSRYSYNSDIIFGQYLMIALILLLYIVGRYKKRVSMMLFGNFTFLLLLCPLSELVHYHLYGKIISDGSMQAVYLTNRNEVIEYILTYVGPTGCGLLLVGLIMWLMICTNVGVQRGLLNLQKSRDWCLWLCLLLICVGWLVFGGLKNTSIGSAYVRVDKFEKKK